MFLRLRTHYYKLKIFSFSLVTTSVSRYVSFVSMLSFLSYLVYFLRSGKEFKQTDGPSKGQTVSVAEYPATLNILNSCANKSTTLL